MEGVADPGDQAFLGQQFLDVVLGGGRLGLGGGGKQDQGSSK